MIFLFKKKEVYTPELVSLHIPKTAGTSFRNILKSVYGDNAVVRFDISRQGTIRLNQTIYKSAELPSTKVIHGHFVFKDLTAAFDLPKGIRKVTWLRDPVQRVISNYYYLESRLKTILTEKKNNLNILTKMQRTLLEYAADDINRNIQSKFLEGISLEQFDFVGINEYFNNDLKIVAQILDWPKVPDPIYHNQTPSKETEQPDEILNEIKKLNSKDMALYENALDMRGLKI